MKGNKRNTLSIIIPVYNTAKYLSSCLGSIVLQDTCSLVEVICVDDGSSDESMDIINSYAERSDLIKVFRQEHKGVSAARNTGIKHATGDYIWFVDSDDMVSEDALSVISRLIKHGFYDLIIFGATVCSENGINVPMWVYNRTNAESKRYFYRTRNLLFKEKAAKPFVWEHVIKRKIITDNNLLFNEELMLGEDQAFQFSYLMKVRTARVISDKLYLYHWGRDGSIMGEVQKEPNKKLEKDLKMIETVLKLFGDNGMGMYKEDIKKWALNLINYDCSLAVRPHEYYEQINKIFKAIDVKNRY